MPEGGECVLVVVPGGAEVGTSTIGRVQTPSRLGGGGSTKGSGNTHMHTRTRTQTHTYTYTHADVTQKGNGTNVVRKMG